MKGFSASIDSFGERSPGSHLREAREAAGISIDKIADSLLLELKTVEALEADAFDRLPAPTFVRGYLRGYARVLGVPAAPIIEMYDRLGFKPPPLVPEGPQTQQAHTSDPPVRLATYVVAAVLMLLVGLWLHSRQDGAFDAGGNLLGGASDPDRESSPSSLEAPGASPAEGDEGGESMASAFGEPGRSFRDDEHPAPSPAEDAARRAVAAIGPTATAPVALGTMTDREISTTPRPGAGIDLPAGVDSATGDDLTAGGDPVTADNVAADGAPAPEDNLAAAADPTAEPESGVAGSANASAPEEDDRPDAAGPASGAALADPTAEPESGAAGSADGSAPEEDDRPDAAGPASGAALTTATSSTTLDATSSQAAPVPSNADVANPSAVTETGQPGLVLEFVHESWVEVYDRERTRLFFGLVSPGRVLSFDGARPFDVLLGFGNDARVTLDGTPFDHTPFLKHGVARFKVGTTTVRDAETTESGDTAPTPATTATPDERSL